MKKLFLSNMGLAPLHFGTELELIDKAINNGDEVYVLKCDGKLSSCFFNPCHNLLGCSICISRTNTFHEKLNIPVENIFSIQPLLDYSTFKTPKFSSLKTLIDYKFDGVNIGRGIASSVISLERDYDVLNNENRLKLIDIQAKMSVNALLNYKKVIEKIQPDEVYLFNGRFAEQFPLVDYCQQKGIKFYTFERGANNQKYQLFEDSLPHSIIARKKIMDQLWATGNIKENAEIGKRWFEAKRKGTNTDDKNYLKKQSANSLPKGFDTNKRNIAIFNSSEDEMKAIGEWENDMYSNQNEAIKLILNHFKANPDFHFYLRMHPNLGKVDNIQTKELYELSLPNFTLIHPFDPVDSFAMVEHCEKTITFGSTIGAEASFWGKPSILFGRSFYEDLDCVYRPNSKEELFQLIATKDLAPKPKINVLKYGYFINTFGTATQKFKFDGKLNSTFKGEKIKRVTFAGIYQAMRLLPDFSLWNRLNKLFFKRNLNFKDLFLLKSHTVD